jgi:hypothetical protein
VKKDANKKERFGKRFNKFGFVFYQTSDITRTRVQISVFHNIAIIRLPKPLSFKAEKSS